MSAAKPAAGIMVMYIIAQISFFENHLNKF